MASGSYTKFGSGNDNLEVQAQGFQPGDVMLKHADFSGTSALIATGQKLTHPLGGDATVVHAAMYIGDNIVAEASGKGVVQNKLSDNLQHYTYHVFRYVGAHSDTIIEAALQRSGFTLNKKTTYSFGGAFKSLFKSKSTQKPEDKVTLLSESKTFCSCIVVDWYNDGALDKDLSPPIQYDGSAASPQALIGILKASPNWDLVGIVGKGS